MLMTRRSILAAGALMATSGLARAQTGAFKGKTLTVASWQNYGADDPATLKMFTDMTGATVKNVFFTSEDGLLQMLRQGGVGQIDACLPNLQYVLPGAQQSLFAPIDTAKVTTWKDLEPRFADDPSIRLDGKVMRRPGCRGRHRSPSIRPLFPPRQRAGRCSGTPRARARSVLRRSDHRDHDSGALSRRRSAEAGPRESPGRRCSTSRRT